MSHYESLRLLERCEELEATLDRIRKLPEKWRMHQDPWIDENDKFRYPPDNNSAAKSGE